MVARGAERLEVGKKIANGVSRVAVGLKTVRGSACNQRLTKARAQQGAIFPRSA